MKQSLLSSKQNSRINVPVWLLVCFSLFTVWQMGIVFFSSSALSIHGQELSSFTPEVSLIVILSGYILSIIFLIFFQKYQVGVIRVVLFLSLIAAVLLLFSFDEMVLSYLLAIEEFLCVFLIGCTISTIINYFTLECEMNDVIITMVVSGVLIAILYNEKFPIPFEVFNIVTLITQVALLVFYWQLPKESQQVYLTKKRKVETPASLIIGILIIILIGCLMTLFENTIAESIHYGVSILYISAAVSSLVFLLLWRRFKLNPLKIAKIFLAIAAIGFLLNVVLPSQLRFIAVALMSWGLTVAQFSALFGIIIFRRWPSRYVAPLIIIIAVITVILHSLLLMAFTAEEQRLLYELYAIIAAALLLIYFLFEPYLTNVWNKDTGIKKVDNPALDRLAPQEQRIVHYMLKGYSPSEIAKALNITLGTFKGYRNTLYSKLYIHSKRELFEIMNNEKAED